ncbi:MAG: flagellar hook-basal body complex protein FliE [Candidatus Sumerlaeia bacterium]
MEINPINVSNRVWSIELGDLGRAQWTKEGLPASPAAKDQGSEFGAMVSEEINKVNDQLLTTDKAVSDLATGQSENLHGALISMQKANLSFKMLVEVRNKALSAYDELMRMQA